MIGNDVKAKVAVLEQRSNDQERIIEKVDYAIQAMQEAATNISKMLAVHEERLDQHSKAESIVIQMIKEQKITLEAEDVDLSDRIDTLETRIEDLKRFKWTAVGIGIALGFIITTATTITSVLTSTNIQGRMEAPPAQTR